MNGYVYRGTERCMGVKLTKSMKVKSARVTASLSKTWAKKPPPLLADPDTHWMYVINTAIFECCRRRKYVREQWRRYKLQSECILPIYTLSCGSLLYRSISKSRTGYGFVHMRQIFRKFWSPGLTQNTVKCLIQVCIVTRPIMSIHFRLQFGPQSSLVDSAWIPVENQFLRPPRLENFILILTVGTHVGRKKIRRSRRVCQPRALMKGSDRVPKPCLTPYEWSCFFSILRS